MVIVKQQFSELLFAILLGGFLWSCGSSPSETKPSETSIKPIGNLLTSLEELNKKGVLATAQMQYAFLYPQQAPAVHEAKSRAMLKTAAWQKIGARLLFVTATVDEGLPVPLTSLAESMQQPNSKREFLNSKNVLLVRYLGPKLPKSEHLTLFLDIAHSVADSYTWAVDLSTRRVVSKPQLSQWTQDSSVMFAEQVIPGVERDEDGTITFYTRGMAKFALPDLERTGVPKSEARESFGAFQDLIQKALDASRLEIGSEFEGFELRACKRKKIAIERDCVNLSPVSQ